MDRVSVTSSNIISVGWENNVLEVEFNSGVYQFDHVTSEQFDELVNTKSPGRYFYENFRNRKGVKVS